MPDATRDLPEGYQFLDARQRLPLSHQHRYVLYDVAMNDYLCACGHRAHVEEFTAAELTAARKTLRMS